MKIELFNDNFQNFKKYNIPKAQLVIADIPYNLGKRAYASSPEWYIGGDNRNGESSKAGKTFFNTDVSFNIAEYFHFCNRLFPGVSLLPTERCRKDNDGMAEALLMAEYAKRRL